MSEYRGILSNLTCPTCGIGYAVPEKFITMRREGREKEGWYCPNGHHLRILHPEIEQIRRERDSLKQQMARLENERAESRRQTAKVAAELARTSRRAVAAVCPCCHRTFSQLARHMKSKHPEVSAIAPVRKRA